MRLLLGARIYLVDPRVITIFKNQKERMGKIIDQLDTDMETHTRLTTQTSIDPVTGAVTTRTVSYTPWKKQNLLTEWNKYMDTKWADATAKHKKVMDKFIKALSDQHCRLQAMKTANDKKFCQRLDKLKIEYRKVKAFSKPW